MRDFARIWRAADKVVYSRTLEEVPTGRTRLGRELDLAALADQVHSSPADVSIGGPTLAAPALRAGLVDDSTSSCRLLSPVVVGGGLRALPGDVRLDLELVDQHRFANGVVHLHHQRRRT